MNDIKPFPILDGQLSRVLPIFMAYKQPPNKSLLQDLPNFGPTLVTNKFS